MSEARVWPHLQPRLEQTAARKAGRWQGITARMRPAPPPPGLYILLYHGIVDPGNETDWERCYRKGQVTLASFREQLDILLDVMEPIAAGDLETLFTDGPPRRPRFLITFDDGYTSLMRNALAETARRSLRPVVFVNGGFAEGGVYYRVLAACLTAKGFAPPLKVRLSQALPETAWSADPGRLFDQTKNCYRAGIIEAAVEEVYRDRIGDPADLLVHLTALQTHTLVAAGWDLGDHTFSHQVLTGLGVEEIEDSCARNRRYWGARALPLRPWLAYPNGRSIDVGPTTKAYLDRHPDIQGFFAAGGVNFAPSRHEWLRLAPGNAIGPAFRAFLRDEAERTRRALTTVSVNP
jgi:peptidoglycan/xylan/chitin deacetylase (PgdA/CDA1 family)